jgi:hypothetical protein
MASMATAPGAPVERPLRMALAHPERPSVLVEELGRRRRRRRLAPVIARDLAGPRVEHHHEGPAAEARRLRLDQTQNRLHRHRRIDRRAALAQHLQPGLDRQRIGRRDERPARHWRDGSRLRRRSGTARRPRQALAARAPRQRHRRGNDGGRDGAQGPERNGDHGGLI